MMKNAIIFRRILHGGMLKIDTAAISLCPWREQILWLQVSSFPSRELLCFHLLQRAAKQCPLKADPFQPFATKMFTFFSLNLSFGSILRTSLSSVSCSSSFHALSTLLRRRWAPGACFLLLIFRRAVPAENQAKGTTGVGGSLAAQPWKSLKWITFFLSWWTWKVMLASRFISSSRHLQPL